MTDEPQTPSQESSPPTTTDLSLSYSGQSRLESSEGSATLALFGNLKRDPVQFDGYLKKPLRLRESLTALNAIVGSDFRYVPKDRSAYNAYQRMKRESANLGAWQAQQAYFDWLLRNDPLAFCILDPVISVQPDCVLFEVFSKDEGTYASLSVSYDAFDIQGKPVCGTTNIDLSDALFQGVLQMRSYRQTRLTIGQQAVEVGTTTDKGDGENVLEKQIKVPDSWLRGFLQVQSAATLPRESFTLAPIDLYNVLRHLRLNGDEKGKRRGLRVELIPGQPPNLILEPWETVVTSSSGVYEGSQARVLRVWGRRRLMLLRRMLPFIQEVEVHLLGSGLPSFWVLRGDGLTLTLGLTGFTSANWSQSACFDLLLPRKTQQSKELAKVVKHLSKAWHDDEAGLSKATKLKGADLLEALQLGCQQGQLMFDIAENCYRLRPVTAEPLDLPRLEYRNQTERYAHDLLQRKAAVSIAQENRIIGTGIELTGKVAVTEDKRDYRPQMLINEEGFVTKAECTCTTFRKQGLKGGPCAHLVALRLSFANLEKKRRESSRSRKSITVETRTWSKRQRDGEQVYQLTLDRQRVRMKWGVAGQTMRDQQLCFNSVDEARDEYLERIDSLSERGFLDASGS